MKRYKGYKVELDPTNEQRTLFRKNIGCARKVWNWGLTIKKESVENKTRVPNSQELHKRLNLLKQGEFAWMYECSSYTSLVPLQDLDRAFKDFFRRCKLRKQGKHKGKVGFPKYKKKKDGYGSFRLYQIGKIFPNKINLPKIGYVRLKEKGYIPTQGVKVINATVSQRHDRWYVSVLVEEEILQISKEEKVIVGVDLGIKTLAVCSDGECYENPRLLNKYHRALARANRKLHRRTPGGKNRKKSQLEVARIHRRIANIRNDNLHKITTHLATTKSVIVIEDLNVRGLQRNRHIARAVSDASLGTFRRYLEYKAAWYGCEVVVADRFFPSSKRCSNCGAVKETLKVSQRIYRCECGLEIDRDLNAALNLQWYGSTVSSTGIDAPGEIGTGSPSGEANPVSLMGEPGGEPRLA